MTAKSGPSQPSRADEGSRRWVAINPQADQHVPKSREMILEAGPARSARAIVLGAGRCTEIPLVELTERFDRTTLVDIDAAELDLAFGLTGLRPEAESRVVKLVADLTGVTDRFVGLVGDELQASSHPIEAVERLAAIAEAVRPEGFSTGEQYDLVVASGVLCQLHVSAFRRAIARFVARFPGEAAAIHQSARWVGAMYGLARRMEDAFIDGLPDLLSPGGKVFLSDSVQGGLLHGTAEGRWMIDGVYRMTRTARLADYLDDRSRVEQEAHWRWVVDPPSGPGRLGKLFNVQALVLSLR